MITIDDVAKFLEPGTFRPLSQGAGKVVLSGPAPIDRAGPGQVSFLGRTAKGPRELIVSARASLVIIDRPLAGDFRGEVGSGVCALVESDNARLDFMRVVDRFFTPARPRGVHPSAVVAASAQLAPDTYVGPHCSLGEQVEVGAGTVIHAGVQIYERVKIGRNVTIHAGSVLGADGFGYERNAEGVLVKFPHVGGVVIEDDVEIGANTCIDRGSLGDTRVCQGARIDNLVHVAHNVVVGRHAAVIAHAMVGGSARIGDYAWVAPSACLRDRIEIGSRAVVGLAAVVTKDVQEGATVMGAPARDAESQKRLLGRLSKLAEEIG